QEERYFCASVNNVHSCSLKKWHGHPARVKSWPRWPCHPDYFPCKKSANGGKVSNIPNAKSRSAVALTLAMATVLVRQRLARMSHVTSQNRIAMELAPESGPVGR